MAAAEGRFRDRGQCLPNSGYFWLRSSKGIAGAVSSVATGFAVVAEATRGTLNDEVECH